MGKNMSYTVTMKNIEKTHASESAAIRQAKQLAKLFPEHKVFISYYRRSDSQHGYINRDGAALTGKAW